MQLIKVAGAVVNQIPMAWEHNKKNILAAIEDAKRQDVSILCLPELCITGYGCEDAFYATGVHRTAAEILYEIQSTYERYDCFSRFASDVSKSDFQYCCLVG